MSECDIVLRISLTRENFSEALLLIEADALDVSWRAGEKRLGGAIHEDSGANVILAEGVDLVAKDGELESIMQRNAGMILALTRLGAKMELDFGVYGEGLVTSVELSKPVLEQLAVLGIPVRVSFYLSD